MSHAMVISPGLLVVCFLIRMPTAIGMTISSTLYLAMKSMDPSVVVEIFTSKVYNNFIFLAAPLSIFAASIVNSGKATDRILDFSKVLVGRQKGGLGHVNVITSLIFSGMTGSAVVSASGFGVMKVEVMRKERYDDGFNATITADSTVTGLIFPPNIPLIIYGVIVGAFIGNLFLAGMVSGIILALALCTYVYYIANKRNYPSGGKYAGTESVRTTVSAILALLTPITLLMGIYIGIMIVTEAGAAVALYTLLISIFAYRSAALPGFIQVLKNMMKSAGQIGIMLGTTYVSPYVIVVENFPSLVGNLILSFATTKVTFFTFANIVLFILGTLLDPVVLQLVLLPVLCPIAQSLGIGMVHFGVVFTLNTMIGLCTPPFGILLFIVMGINGEKINIIVEEVMPVALVTILVLVFVVFVPNVVMWLSRLLGR